MRFKRNVIPRVVVLATLLYLLDINSKHIHYDSVGWFDAVECVLYCSNELLLIKVNFKV